MRMLIMSACYLLLALPAVLAEAQDDTPRVRRQLSNSPYRVGLMFAGGAAEQQGLLVHDVVPKGAASAAGIKAGDLITHINGTGVDGPASKYAPMFGAPDPIAIRVLRDGEPVELTLTPRRVPSAGNSMAAHARSNREKDAEGVSRIPTRMDYGKPTVLAKINGKGPWHFFVDSGAGATVLDRALVRELALPVTGKRRMGGPSDPQAINADLVQLESITVGTAEFRDVEVVSWDRSDLYKTGDRPRGVLGIGLFADYLLSFDYPAGEIALSKGELPPVDNGEVIPYTLAEHGLPVIQISLGGKSLAAHFDTGSPGSLGVPAKIESTLSLKTPPKVMGKARTVWAEFEIRGATLDGELRIGGHEFQDPQIMLLSVLDNMDAAVIGSRLLRDFVLTFDQKNERIRMARP